MCVTSGFGFVCLCTCSKPANTACLEFTLQSVTSHIVRHWILQEHKTETELVLLLDSALFTLVCDRPAFLLESSAVLAPCLLDGTPPCGPSDSLFSPPYFLLSKNCLLPRAFNPSLTLSLLWELFGNRPSLRPS